MSTNKIRVERDPNKVGRPFTPVQYSNGGMKQRVGWEMIEQLLRNNGFIKFNEGVNAYEVDANGIVFTIGEAVMDDL